MTADIHHEVGRFDSRESARHILRPETVAIELANGEVVVGGPKGGEGE